MVAGLGYSLLLQQAGAALGAEGILRAAQMITARAKHSFLHGSDIKATLGAEGVTVPAYCLAVGTGAHGTQWIIAIFVAAGLAGQHDFHQ
jgi:hypothetical protein